MVSVGEREFMVSGGVRGSHISALTPTADSFLVTLSSDLKSFRVQNVMGMK